jgi:hypothetical protein
MSDLDLETARNETVNEISACLYRLSRANKLLTLAQRVALAEIARDLADAFDEGKVLMPSEKTPRRHVIRTAHVDKDGSPLFGVVHW